MGWMVNAMSWPLHPGKRTGTQLQEAGWTPGPLWTGVENLTTGIRSPNPPASSESQHQVS